MVQVKWNYEDARFTCYNDEVFIDKSAAKKSIYDWAIKNKVTLYDSQYIEIDEGELWINSFGNFKSVSYEEWVEWCIDAFCSFNELKVHE